MDRGIWWATVHGVSESDTTKETEQACTHTHIHTPALLLLLCAKVEEPELNSVFLQDPSFMMCHFDCMTFSRHNLSLGPMYLDK